MVITCAFAAPPFDEPSIPTHFAVRACQAGFDRDQLISHFQQYGADDESLYTMIHERTEHA